VKKCTQTSEENYLFFSFLWYWSLNSGPSPWVTPPALFLWRVFQDRISQTVCLARLPTVILLISASWVARIAGVSHRCPAWRKLFGVKIL
jgi:hypothetical protein